MPNMNALPIPYDAELSAVLIRADGSRQDLGTISRLNYRSLSRWFRKAVRFLGFAAAAWLLIKFFHNGAFLFGLVTNSGVNYMASDFASGGVTPTISGLKFHDCGTGTTAAAVTDTALQTPAGTSRVSGTASNPSANIYQSVATINFTSSLAITEWGIFSASSTGTMWDHRVFSAINVNNGDGIQFTYKLTISSGGS